MEDEAGGVIVVTAVISLLSLYFIYVRQPPQLVPLLITQHPQLQQRDVREPLNAHVRQAQPPPQVNIRNMYKVLFGDFKALKLQQFV